MRALILLIGIPWAIFVQARERVRFLFRRRLGDAGLRSSCCGPLPAEYDEGLPVARIGELAGKTELVATMNTGYSFWYGCRVCGQEWIQQHIGSGHGEVPHVVKAS